MIPAYDTSEFGYDMRAVLLAWPGCLGYTDWECVCSRPRGIRGRRRRRM